jgi:hypothetical protein
MWIYQSESKELIDKKDSLKDIFLSFLRHNKETIVKLNGSEFTVNFYKDSSLHYFKSFFVVLNRDETFEYDWIFTRVLHDISLNPSNAWTLDFKVFGKISNNTS